MPPQALDPALAAQFEQIRRQFVAGLARREREIDEAPDAQAVHAALHRLAGAAGGFGFAALGDMARQAMQAGARGDAAQLAARLAPLKAEMRRLAQA